MRALVRPTPGRYSGLVMWRLRLINPRNPPNGLVDSRIARRVTFRRKAIFMPLGLAVAAGVVPATCWRAAAG